MIGIAYVVLYTFLGVFMLVQAELSTKLGSDVPVVMIQFNVDHRFSIPSWAEVVQDFHTETAPNPHQKVTGRKILECQQVKMTNILTDLERENYIPLRFVVVERRNGRSVRMVLVCVHRDHIEEGKKRMKPAFEGQVRLMLSQFFWDERIYRNPGSNGGNFIIALGGYVQAQNKESFATQRIKDHEFELVTPL